MLCGKNFNLTVQASPEGQRKFLITEGIHGAIHLLSIANKIKERLQEKLQIQGHIFHFGISL